MSMPPFHLAFPVKDIASTRTFYEEVLNCIVGRQGDRWIDFDFFGHQISAHLTDQQQPAPLCNQVDNKAVPARHFGVILDCDDWDKLVARVHKHQVAFYIAPYTRFAGEVGEQRTFFIQDPSENFLEFKCFRDPKFVFRFAQQ